MSNLYWLTEARIERLKPFSPRAMASPGLMIEGSEWHNLHQSQWLAVVRRAWGVWSGQNSLQPLQTLG